MGLSPTAFTGFSPLPYSVLYRRMNLGMFETERAQSLFRPSISACVCGFPKLLKKGREGKKRGHIRCCLSSSSLSSKRAMLGWRISSPPSSLPLHLELFDRLWAEAVTCLTVVVVVTYVQSQPPGEGEIAGLGLTVGRAVCPTFAPKSSPLPSPIRPSLMYSIFQKPKCAW